MGKKIYITEAQMKAFTRSLLIENTTVDFVKQFINNIEPEIDFIEINGEYDGEIGLIYKNERNEEIAIYINFEFNYGYEGKKHPATHLTPSEYPEFKNDMAPKNVSFYIYTSELTKEYENIQLVPHSPNYDLCVNLIQNFEDEINDKIVNSGKINSYDDYMEDMRERSLGI